MILKPQTVHSTHPRLYLALLLFINTLTLAPESVIWKIYLTKTFTFSLSFSSPSFFLFVMQFQVIDLNSS